MKKGINELAWLASGILIIVLVSVVAIFFINAKVDIALEFPETSARLSSYSLLHRALSEDCLGTGISGVISVDRLDQSADGELECMSKPSMSYYIRVQSGSGDWEFSDIESGNEKFFSQVTSRFELPVAVELGDGTRTPGRITILTSYINREILVFMRSCAEAALIEGECVSPGFGATRQRLEFDGSTICKETDVESMCLSISGEFNDRYVKTVDSRISRMRMVEEDGGLAVYVMRINDDGSISPWRLLI